MFYSNLKRRNPDEIAQRVVQDIPEGAHVNLGIGMPMRISNHLPRNREILLQSENGLLGMGPLAAAHEVDTELVNAGKQPVTMLPGASLFNHAESFAMIRGGHLDICVLGAFEVSVNGDLANWRTNDDDAIPAVGGAMDLAHGAKLLFVMMDHLLLSSHWRPVYFQLRSADSVGRALAEGMSARLGQPIVVENRPGANGNLAADLVARSAPDGYTLYFPSVGHAVNVSLYKRLTYDPVKDFTPIGKVFTAPNMLVVPAKSPFRSANELIAFAKANPKKLNFASSGQGMLAPIEN
ncbi:MAG: hypothetical protein EBY14_12970 [Betaproteobacteria bacterium]|nr:hypothetical protein [Betaproteobacteria bacterium]